MRKIIFNLVLASALLFLISFISFASAELQWNQQPNSLYNLGDVVKTSPVISGNSFSAYLVCNDAQVMQFSTSFTDLPLVNYTIPLQFTLTPALQIGSPGICKIKAALDGINYFSSQFQISNVINVTVLSGDKEFKPGSQVSISGTAIKQNGQNIDGVANINISGNSVLYQGSAPVNNGNFYFNLTIPPTAAAGQYLVKITSSESDSSGAQTNTGYTFFNIQIDQIPTTLNLVPINDFTDIMPGRTYYIQPILYDQTGQEINSSVSFTVRNSNGEIMDQKNATTGQMFSIPVSYDDVSGAWSIFAESDGLTAQAAFKVLKNSAISASLINTTLLVTNKGNVPYDDSIYVKVGNQTIAFNVSLDVGQSQKYVLKAPDGNYQIEVSSSDGNSLYSGRVLLTGNAVNVQQATQGVVSFIQYPVVWIALILILVFAIFFLFRKVRKGKFMKKINMNRNFKLRDGILISNGETVSNRGRMVKSRNIAEFSSSIQGEKQTSSIVCLDIKNFEDIRNGKGGVNETMNRLKYLADESNAVVYENGTFFFFIFAPIKTSEFNNELNAIETAQKIRKILEDHNRLMKQKIDFGISVNYGNIIAKHGINGLKFMSLGSLISVAKRLAAVSNGEVALSKEIRDRVATDVKTDKRFAGDLEFYPLTEIRNREKSEKFIKEFMSKMEREERERQI